MWNRLNSRLNPIRKKILKKWLKLVSKNANEEVYHEFLSEHAGLFLADCVNSYVVVSKFRLGADYTTDFIVAHDRHSAGTHYEMIEIETPHHSPVTRKGFPSARLSNAIQQILDWRSWMLKNRNEVLRCFPTSGMRFLTEPNFEFTIIIGSRSEVAIDIEKRNNLAKSLSVNIRSFDYLTDRLKHRVFNDYSLLESAEETKISNIDRIMLANPFFKAFPDHVWRSIIKKGLYHPHMLARNVKTFLEFREYNAYYGEFTKK